LAQRTQAEHSDIKLRISYRILASKKMKGIMELTKTNMEHKPYQHVIKQIRKELTQKRLMVCICLQ